MFLFPNIYTFAPQLAIPVLPEKYAGQYINNYGSEQ